MAFSFATLKNLLQADSPHVSTKASVLGIDIGSSAIKIIQLKDIKGTPTLETYGELQLGPYEGVELGRNTHLPAQKATEALMDIMREAGVTARQASFALSYNSSFTSVVSFATVDQEQIPTMLPVEARKYIPVSLAKLTLDWLPLAIDEKAKTTTVLISALYNEAIAHYETIMKGGGLAVMAHEVEIFSAIRSIVRPEDEVVAILDFGASSTRLYIVERGMLRKTHSVPMSGVELTRALVEELSIEFAQAEELKRNVGLEGKAEDPRIQKRLLSEVGRGLRELHTVIKRYGETEGGVVQKVLLSGGGANLRGLQPYMSDMFSLPTVLGEPFVKVAYPAFLQDTLKEVGPSFAVALGVALQSFVATEK